MTYSEQVIMFDCTQESMVGILALPPAVSVVTGVVVIVGGPQYRAGSHRQFVLLSRALAAAGFPVLRFDYRGMGDSTGPMQDFMKVTPDIEAAIDAMRRAVPELKSIVLWGLCDGASAALMYIHDRSDDRIRGLCLVNPWVRSDSSLARTHVKHYYWDRLRQGEFWARLIGGKITRTALTGLFRNIRLMLDKSQVFDSSTKQRFQDRMASGWKRFTGPALIFLSSDDYVAKEFLEYAEADRTWAALLRSQSCVRQDLSNSDHTISNQVSRVRMECITINWLQEVVSQ